MTRNRAVIRIFRVSSGILKIDRILNMRPPGEISNQSVLLADHDSVFDGRGFILLRTGFLAGGMTSAVPPLAAIFSAADFEKWCARTVRRLLRSPVPSTRT